MVVDSALRHLPECVGDHFEKALISGCVIVTKKKFVDSRIWKLWRLSQPSVFRIVSPSNLLSAFGDRVRGEDTLGLGGLRHALQAGENLANALLDILRSVSISLRNTCQNFRESRHAVAIFRREIGTAVKGL